MVKKLQKSRLLKAPHTELKESVKDSAQQIWQAGLGAFTRAQAEGSKAFESLVKEGVSMQRKTQAVAEEKINEATTKVSSMATGISTKASGQWDKLENIFEDRVAKALNKLGVPSAKDVNALIARIDELNRAVEKLSAKATGVNTGSKEDAPVKTRIATVRKTASKSTKAISKPAVPAVETPEAPSVDSSSN